jgi:hypothetical protein
MHDDHQTSDGKDRKTEALRAVRQLVGVPTVA